MTQPRNERINDTFRLVGDVHEDSLESFFDKLRADPKIEEDLLRRLARVNPRLAQRLLIESQKVEAGQPEEAFTQGALAMLGALATEDEAIIDQSFAKLVQALELEGQAAGGPEEAA